MNEVSLSKEYSTRAGETVRLLCLDAAGKYPVVGMINGVVHQWMPDGKYSDEGCHSGQDLIEYTEPDITFHNIYRKRFGNNAIAFGAGRKNIPECFMHICESDGDHVGYVEARANWAGDECDIEFQFHRRDPDGEE